MRHPKPLYEVLLSIALRREQRADVSASVLSETLAMELAPFNIRVLILEPGGFRTEGMLSGPFFDANPIPDYAAMKKVAKDRFKEYDGKQPGDPVKAMRAVVDVVRGENFALGRTWPLYLPLGVETIDAMGSKYNTVNKVLTEWDPLIRNTRLDNP